MTWADHEVTKLEGSGFVKSNPVLLRGMHDSAGRMLSKRTSKSMYISCVRVYRVLRNS